MTVYDSSAPYDSGVGYDGTTPPPIPAPDLGTGYDEPDLYDTLGSYDGDETPFVPVPGIDTTGVITYHAYDLVTGTYKATLPFVGVSFGGQLNGSGTFSGTLPLTDPGVRALDPWDATIPGRSLIVVDLDGAVIDGYIVWPRTRKRSKKAIEIQGAQQVWSYFAKRAQATDYSSPPNSGISPSSPMPYWANAPADPTLIATQLLADALAYYKFGTVTVSANILGGIGILINNGLPGTPVTPSDAWISPSYPYSSISTIDSLISQLSQMGFNESFDYGLDLQYSAGQYSPLIGTVHLDYPRRGRLASDNQLVLNLNLARDDEFPEDASTQGTTIYETGVPGTLWIEDNLFPVEQGWPVLEQIISHTSANGPNASGIVASLARSDSFYYSYPAVAGTAVVDLFGIDPQLGEFVCGDDIRVLAEPDECYPNGFDSEWRIVSYQATVPESGDATMTLTLNVPPGTGQATGPAI